MMMTLDVGKLSELLKLAPRYLFAIVLVGVLTILLPQRAIVRLGLTESWSSPRLWIGMASLLAASLLLAHAFGKTWESILRRRSHHKGLKEREKRLKNLTVPEKTLLKGFVDRGTRSRQLKYDDGVVVGLVREGMLYYASDRATSFFDPQNYYTQINLELWAWEFLKRHPHLLAEDGGAESEGTPVEEE